MPSSFYDPPEDDFEHDDECELLDEDTLADETITECSCEERLLERMEEPEPDDDDDDDDDWPSEYEDGNDD